MPETLALAAGVSMLTMGVHWFSAEIGALGTTKLTINARIGMRFQRDDMRRDNIRALLVHTVRSRLMRALQTSLLANAARSLELSCTYRSIALLFGCVNVSNLWVVPH